MHKRTTLCAFQQFYQSNDKMEAFISACTNIKANLENMKTILFSFDFLAIQQSEMHLYKGVCCHLGLK